jgi:polyhydroxyalkanoate synthase
VLVPSLINPPTILDLDPGLLAGRSTGRATACCCSTGGRPPARKDLSLDEHVAERLVPLIEAVGPVTLVGYCLGRNAGPGRGGALPGRCRRW